MLCWEINAITHRNSLVYCSSILHKSYEELQGSVTSLKHFLSLEKCLLYSHCPAIPEYFTQLWRCAFLCVWEDPFLWLPGIYFTGCFLLLQHKSLQSWWLSTRHVSQLTVLQAQALGLHGFAASGITSQIHRSPMSLLWVLPSLSSRESPWWCTALTHSWTYCRTLPLSIIPCSYLGPSLSHRLPDLCSLDLWDCRQLLFSLLQLMPHLCSTAQDEKRPVPCSVGRNRCQWTREAIAVEAGSTVYPRQRICFCREPEDSCTNPHQLRWVLELLEPWFVFKKVTRRMESEGKGARNRAMGCTHMVSGGYSPGCWVVSDCQGITQPWLPTCPRSSVSPETDSGWIVRMNHLSLWSYY